MKSEHKENCASKGIRTTKYYITGFPCDCGAKLSPSDHNHNCVLQGCPRKKPSEVIREKVEKVLDSFIELENPEQTKLRLLIDAILNFLDEHEK